MTRKKAAAAKAPATPGMDDDGIMLEILASVIETTVSNDMLEEHLGLSAHEIGKRLRRISHGDWQGAIPRWQKSQ